MLKTNTRAARLTAGISANSDTFRAALQAAGPPFKAPAIVLETSQGQTLFTFKSLDEMHSAIEQMREDGHKIEARSCYAATGGAAARMFYHFIVDYEINPNKAEDFNRMSAENRAQW